MLDASSLILGGLSSSKAASDKTAAATKSLNQTYDQFLNLLTTQLKNQDPLNPMDSKDFTSQLIGMANTEQQIAQTQKMDELIQLNQASSVNQALNYIGMDVKYSGTAFTSYVGYPTPITYNLAEAGAQGKISILNEKDEVVYSKNAELEAGDHTFTWDGKDNTGKVMPAGNYHFAVGVLNATKASVASTTVVPGLVTGIDTNADGQVLLKIGGQKVPISAVQSVYIASATPTPTPAATTATGAASGAAAAGATTPPAASGTAAAATPSPTTTS